LLSQFVLFSFEFGHSSDTAIDPLGRDDLATLHRWASTSGRRGKMSLFRRSLEGEPINAFVKRRIASSNLRLSECVPRLVEIQVVTSL
jgi:hypothetical protein